MFTIALRNLAEIALFDLQGRLIADAGNDFLGTVSNRVVEHGARKIVLNFKELQQCDSMGISAILRIHNSLENMGGRLVICEMNDLVTKVFMLTRIYDVLHIAHTEEEALEEFHATSLLNLPH
jgi:anti-anti-sigma factor